MSTTAIFSETFLTLSLRRPLNSAEPQTCSTAIESVTMNTTEIWDDTQEDQPDKDTKIHLEHLFQDGFRTGVATGQEEMVQSGFDEGYKKGMKEGMEWGTIVGLLRTYHALGIQTDASQTTDKLKMAAEKVETISPQEAYATVYNKLVDQMAVNQGLDADSTVQPERMEVNKKVNDSMEAVKMAVEQSGM